MCHTLPCGCEIGLSWLEVAGVVGLLLKIAISIILSPYYEEYVRTTVAFDTYSWMRLNRERRFLAPLALYLLALVVGLMRAGLELVDEGWHNEFRQWWYTGESVWV